MHPVSPHQVYHRLNTSHHIMSSSQPTKILLLGAGELGTAFLPHLSALPNTHITIGVRSPSKYTHLARSNVHITQIDLGSDSALLAEEFSKQDILISATGFGQSPSTVLKLAHEALDAGALKGSRGQGQLWFFPWQWGVNYDIIGDGEGLMPLFGAQKAVRELLRSKASSSNVKWTVVSTGIFMSFLFEPFWGIIDTTQLAPSGKLTVRCLRDWRHEVTVTDVHDIGKVLARIVAGDIDANDRILYVSGDTIRYGELADLIEHVTEKEVVREKWSIPYLEEELKKDPENGIKKYRLVFARDGVCWNPEESVNYQLEIPTLDLDTYATKWFSEQQAK